MAVIDTKKDHSYSYFVIAINLLHLYKETKMCFIEVRDVLFRRSEQFQSIWNMHTHIQIRFKALLIALHQVLLLYDNPILTLKEEAIYF